MELGLSEVGPFLHWLMDQIRLYGNERKRVKPKLVSDSIINGQIGR